MKTVKTGEGLVRYAQAHIGAPYWFGTYGQISSETLYEKKRAEYRNEYKWECKNNQPDTLPEIQLGVQVFDCSGLIKGFLWSDSIYGIPTYNAEQDLSANGLFVKSPQKGEIDTLPEIRGLLVFAKNHVGVYAGGGKVIDARGHKYGVVQTGLKDRAWTHWGYCPWVRYE